MSHGPYITSHERATFVELYYDGLSFREIGRKTGRAAEVVRRHLIATGDYQPNPRAMLDAKMKHAVELYRRGYRVEDIMDACYINTPTTLYRHLRRQGVPLRQKS